jgi:Xaa-Pro dipeptidase
MTTRRTFLGGGLAVAALLPTGFLQARTAAPTGGLKSMTGGAQAISADERAARIAKLQKLMVDAQVGALLVESGTSLDYFTGIKWRRSERTTLAVIPARGETLVITPAFEEPSVRETLQVAGDVRPWNEHESPFERIAEALRDRGVSAGRVATESTVRFFIVDGVRRAADGIEIVSGDTLVRACRLIKSPAELALMQVANDVTLAAIRHVRAHVKTGMRAGDIGELLASATTALGGAGDGGLILLNEASAYPHGSVKPQSVHEGSVILIDCGCSVHGYESDISRTWIHGVPTPRQRKIWNTVKRGQEIVLETARLDVPVGSIDDAVRRYYESEGWGPGYQLPGLPHRAGHGIGMDGHESPYLVHGDATPLAAGMCFSDEPGIYVPGEFGIRLEDCWYMTATGAKTFTPLARSIDAPF